MKNKIFIIFIVLCACNLAGQKEVKYYPNGMKQYEVDTKDGLREGVYKEYYLNGTLKSIVPFSKGKINGEVIKYDSLGKIESELLYNNNVKNGKFREYYSNGQIRLEGYLKNGKPDSLGLKYFENGTLHEVYYYEKDSLKYFKGFKQNGKCIYNIFPVSIIPCQQKEKYPFNEDHLVIISLDYSYYKNARIGLIFGTSDSSNKIVDTIAVHGAKDLDYVYKVKPQHRGVNEITGYIVEIKMPEDRPVGKQFFRYRYLVE